MTDAEDRSGKHILVIENDKELRDILCDALELEGYSAVSAENGESALRHLATGAKPCMILLDLMMPVMDGWAFRQELLKHRSLAAIPIIVMTAATPASVGAVASQAILYKPLHMRTVINAVQQHCPDGASGDFADIDRA